MRLQVTKYDVAEYCGLSHMSVTRVLNGSPNVSGTVRERVLSACKKLNYRPNFTARALRLRKHCTVGVLMYGEGHFYGILNIFLQRHLSLRGYNGIFVFWKSQDELDKAFASLVSRNVDGIITVEECGALKREGLPTVISGKKVEDYDYVTFDFKHMMEQSFKYLTNLGHQRIGFIGKFDDERFTSYRNLLGVYRLASEPEWCQDHNLLNGGVEDGIRRIIMRSNRPTAIICYNDNVALGAICAVAEHGLKIPEDISIIGCDNLPESAFYNPRLTTFDLNIEKLAETLVSTLLHRIQHPHSKHSSSVLRPEIVIRKSCGEASD
ncbi:MAG: hypothetical protein A2X49_00885 [Lentisphaerae bacterium GWF2_52_8]|nr:MAG: hypothetical protein A2X49_00885 [Lentisphaerae bacterium GWF2_52_8]